MKNRADTYKSTLPMKVSPEGLEWIEKAVELWFSEQER